MQCIGGAVFCVGIATAMTCCLASAITLQPQSSNCFLVNEAVTSVWLQLLLTLPLFLLEQLFPAVVSGLVFLTVAQLLC